MAMAAAEPSPAAVITWARGLTALPAAQTPGTLVRPVGSTTTQPSAWVSQPSSVSRRGVGDEGGPDEDGVAAYDLTGVELDAREPVALDCETGDAADDDPDGPGQQLLPLARGQRRRLVEVDDVVGPLPHDQGVLDGLRGATDDTEPLVADLVAVAVGAVQHVPAPALGQARDGRAPASLSPVVTRTRRAAEQVAVAEPHLECARPASGGSR